jgi:hypothetical protein
MKKIKAVRAWGVESGGKIVCVCLSLAEAKMMRWRWVFTRVIRVLITHIPPKPKNRSKP